MGKGHVYQFGAQNMNLGHFSQLKLWGYTPRAVEIHGKGLHQAQKFKVPRLSSNFEEIRPRTVEIDGNY